MITVFGDMYDHFNDTARNAVIIGLLMWKSTHRVPVGITITILGITAIYHMGCQELFYDKPEESPFLHAVNVCRNKNDIYVSRYFGTGTFILVVTLMIAF